MILYEFRQFSLFLQHGSLPLTFTLICPPSLPPAFSIVLHWRLLREIMPLLSLVVLFLVSGMIDLQRPAHKHETSQVVNCQIRAALILILQKCKTFGLSGLLVANEVDVNRFAVLGEYRNNIAFRELEMEATNVDISCVAIVCMP